MSSSGQGFAPPLERLGLVALVVTAGLRARLARTRHREARETRDDAPVRHARPRRRPGRRARDLASAQIELPVALRLPRDDLELVEPAPEHIKGADIEIDAGERGNRIGSGADGGLLALPQRKPVVDVEMGQLAAHPDAGTLGPCCVRTVRGAPEREQDAIHGGAAFRELPMHGDLRDTAVGHVEMVFTLRRRVAAALDAQRHGVARRLAERRRQVDDGALHRAFEHPRRLPGPHVDGDRPVDRPRKSIEIRRRVLAPQQSQIRRAVAADPNAALGTRDRELRGTAHHVDREIARAQAVLGERDFAVDLRERGCVRKAQFAVREQERAGDLVGFGLLQRQRKLEGETAVPRAGRAIGEMTDHPGDRAVLDEAQEIGNRSGRAAFDRELWIRTAKLGDRRARAAELNPERVAARSVDAHSRGIETNVGIDVFERGPATRIRERHALGLGGDDELPAFRIGERKRREIARKLHPHIGRHSLAQRRMQPIAHGGMHRKRQVAIGLLGIGTRELRDDVDLARALRVGAIGPGEAARTVGVGEVERADVDPRAIALALPADRPLQRVERNRLGKHARKFDAGGTCRELQLAACQRRLEASGEAACPGKRVLRDDAELVECRRCRQCRRRVERPFPAQSPLRKRAARRETRKVGTQLLRQRQMRREIAQRIELQAVEFHAAVRGSVRGRIAERRRERRRIEPLRRSASRTRARW